MRALRAIFSLGRQGLQQRRIFRMSSRPVADSHHPSSEGPSYGPSLKSSPLSVSFSISLSSQISSRIHLPFLAGYYQPLLGTSFLRPAGNPEKALHSVVPFGARRQRLRCEEDPPGTTSGIGIVRYPSAYSAGLKLRDTSRNFFWILRA